MRRNLPTRRSFANVARTKNEKALISKWLDPMIAGPEGGPSSDMQRFED